ncbi:unnamed protein product [Clonostachys rosea]|uniref:Uncharacterized protein n=1 Tax=Bionectria ochroleuca TaxID=29856 RepID=A0ABY6U5P5_BIOOC|nr:unnamed protein product [Clonostachys rosea]
MFCRIQDAYTHPDLRELLQQTVANIVVEFTDGGPDMPHAELRLILAEGVKLTGDDRIKTIIACSIGSNPHLVPRPYFGMYSTTTFRTEEQSYGSAHSFASFVFEPRQRKAKVRDYLSALNGEDKRLPRHSTNLLHYDSLVRMPNLGGKFGYESRDVIAQWVARLKILGFMGWKADSVKSSYDRLLLPENPSLEFHDFITKGYEELEDETTVQMTHDIPLYRGYFFNRDFDRVIWVITSWRVLLYQPRFNGEASRVE